MSTTHHTFCRICEAFCGLEVDVEGGQATAIRPDKEHVASKGFGCIKGMKQHQIFGSPDRLKRPLMRKDGVLVEVTWEEVLADIGTRVRGLRAAHGPDSIGMFVGTTAAHSLLHLLFSQGFIEGIGSKNMFSSSTQDCSNKFVLAQLMYGSPFVLPFPDIERSNCLILVGANPMVSKWALLQSADPYARLHAAVKRGAKVFVVDPRRNETAKAAGEHLFIRPDADVFFFLAFLREIFALGAVDRRRAAAYMCGIDEVEAMVRPWTPERCAEATQIAPETLRRMVKAYVEADGAAMYCSTGVNMGSDGGLAFWLQECINALSGNLDRLGGTLVAKGIFDAPRVARMLGLIPKQAIANHTGAPRFWESFPGTILADEILSEHPQHLRALFVTGGNPLLSLPNSLRIREALAQLDLLVCVDVFPNETTTLATHVLPAASGLQRPDISFVVGALLGAQTVPHLQATRAVLPLEDEQRDEATIYHDLCRACGTGLFGSKLLTALLEIARRVRRLGVPQEAIFSLILRLSGQGSFKKLLTQPHGRLRPPHEANAGTFLGKRVVTTDGKVHLAPTALLAAAQVRLPRHFEAELAHKDALKLITRRTVTSQNSWTHNFPDFVGARHNTNELLMHPDDAAARGIDDGGAADLSTTSATIRAKVCLTPDIMPGTVALAFGWGHQHTPGLSTARTTTGVNVNLLHVDGPDAYDPVGGMAHLTGIVVEVRRAPGERATGSWSGLPASTS